MARVSVSIEGDERCVSPDTDAKEAVEGKSRLH